MKFIRKYFVFILTAMLFSVGLIGAYTSIRPPADIDMDKTVVPEKNYFKDKLNDYYNKKEIPSIIRNPVIDI